MTILKEILGLILFAIVLSTPIILYAMWAIYELSKYDKKR